MKVKFNKSLIIFIVAILALFFFMSLRSNDDGKSDTPGKLGGDCGWVGNKIVHCKKSFCTKQPKKNGEKGTCTGDKTKSWRKNK